MNKFIAAMLFCAPYILGAQNVGINTTNPQATLHVNGDLKFVPKAGATPTRLISTNADGDVMEMPLSSEFNIVGGELQVNELIDENILLVGDVDLSTVTDVSGVYNDLDVGIEGSNVTNTIVRITGETNNYTVTGFDDGFDGRVIYFYNAGTVNMTFKDEDTDSAVENRIITGTGGDESIVGEGVAEFIYDEVLARWVLINIRA